MLMSSDAGGYSEQTHKELMRPDLSSQLPRPQIHSPNLMSYITSPKSNPTYRQTAQRTVGSSMFQQYWVRQAQHLRCNESCPITIWVSRLTLVSSQQQRLERVIASLPMIYQRVRVYYGFLQCRVTKREDVSILDNYKLNMGVHLGELCLQELVQFTKDLPIRFFTWRLQIIKHLRPREVSVRDDHIQRWIDIRYLDRTRQTLVRAPFEAV